LKDLDGTNLPEHKVILIGVFVDVRGTRVIARACLALLAPDSRVTSSIAAKVDVQNHSHVAEGAADVASRVVQREVRLAPEARVWGSGQDVDRNIPNRPAPYPQGIVCPFGGI
jgi:hypothetical protein